MHPQVKFRTLMPCAREHLAGTSGLHGGARDIFSTSRSVLSLLSLIAQSKCGPEVLGLEALEHSPNPYKQGTKHTGKQYQL